MLSVVPAERAAPTQVTGEDVVSEKVERKANWRMEPRLPEQGRLDSRDQREKVLEAQVTLQGSRCAAKVLLIHCFY